MVSIWPSGAWQWVTLQYFLFAFFTLVWSSVCSWKLFFIITECTLAPQGRKKKYPRSWTEEMKIKTSSIQKSFAPSEDILLPRSPTWLVYPSLVDYEALGYTPNHLSTWVCFFTTPCIKLSLSLWDISMIKLSILHDLLLNKRHFIEAGVFP